MIKPRLHRPAFLVASTGLASLLTGCALGPGMSYGPSSPSSGRVDSTSSVGEVRVHMRTLDPASIRDELSRRADADTASLGALFQPVDEPYRLGKSDVVSIAVWDHPELSLPFGEFRTDLTSGSTINERGEIFYPYAGYVRAAGLTASELQKSLAGSLSGVINNPQLDVRVLAYRSKKVFVTGAVGAPGSIAITDIPLTLVDALAQCRGMNAATADLGADPTRVELVRGETIHRLDLTQPLPDGRDPSRIRLQDGDQIRVPAVRENKVYVLGEVSRQMSVPMSSGRLTVAEALVEAGGINSGAGAAGRVYVVRSRGGALDVWRLDARTPLALALADQFPLRPRDIVYVDASGLAAWNRIVSLLLPTAQLLETSSGAALNVYNIRELNR